jgi:hypothetical protein
LRSIAHNLDATVLIKVKESSTDSSSSSALRFATGLLVKEGFVLTTPFLLGDADTGLSRSLCLLYECFSLALPFVPLAQLNRLKSSLPLKANQRKF